MSQVSQGSQDEGSRNWLENILPLLSEARDMFSGDEEVNKVYEVSDSLQKMDQARSKELDTLKEKLRGECSSYMSTQLLM
jgi:septal ring factor EnvC (AmiA/AmiB activator)